MFMTAFDKDEATLLERGNIDRPAIIVVSPPCLLMDCLVEVLRLKFPSSMVNVYDDLVHLPNGICGEARLVLFYHQDMAPLSELIGHLRQLESGISIGIVIDDHNESGGDLSELAATQQIDGVLPLNLRLDVFLAAVDLLAKGGEHFPSSLLQHLKKNGAVYGTPARLRVVPPPHAEEHDNCDAYALTTRKVEILNMICKGTQNKIIAGRLKLSENTVKVHIRNIYKKMQVRNRTEAASRYFDHDGWPNNQLPLQ